MTHTIYIALYNKNSKCVDDSTGNIYYCEFGTILYSILNYNTLKMSRLRN